MVMDFNQELPLSPAPSPLPSIRRLRINTLEISSLSSVEEAIIADFQKLEPDRQARLISRLLESAPRETLLSAQSVISPRLRHDPFKVFPLEISLRILSYIRDPKSLAAAAQVSRLWYFLLSDDSTWKRMCQDHHFRRLSAAGSYVHQWKDFRERASSQALEDTPEPEDGREDEMREDERREAERRDEHRDLSLSARRNSLLSSQHQAPNTEAAADSLETGISGYPSIHYTSRLPTFDQAVNGSDPIGEAYYDPQACLINPPDSYRSHFRQQYLLNQAWAHHGVLAARYSLPEHAHAIVTTILMSDGYIVIALDTSLILVFSDDGKLLRSLYGHVMGVWALALSGHTLVSGGCDRDVREWDLQTGACRKILRGHSSTVRCLAMVSPRIALSGGRDGIIRVWDLERGLSLHRLAGHEASVRRIEVTEVDGEPLAVSASYDKTARVWNVNTGECLHVLRGHTNQIYSLSIDSLGGGRIATGSLDHTIRVWDIRTGKSLGVLTGHAALVGQVALRGDLLVSGGSDGAVRIWDVSKMECRFRIAAHDHTVGCLKLTGDRIVTGGPDCKVQIWNARSGEHVRQLRKPSVTTVWGVAMEDDRLLTVYSEGSQVVVELVSFVPK